MSFPTQSIVENCLFAVFPGLRKGCLNQSISVIGNVPEAHYNPGAMGTLAVRVSAITGVDIPIMVKDDANQGNKTVVIVAQDPLRDTKDPLLQPFSPFKVPIVGTPFAFHYKSCVCKQTHVYCKVIHGLIQKGYDVYVTDIWKCWDKSHTTRNGRWNSNNPHYQCLVGEINSIKPDYVILMGNQAKNKFKNLRGITCNAAKKSVLHPSGSANGKWKGLINPISPQTKADYILNLIP